MHDQVPSRFTGTDVTVGPVVPCTVGCVVAIAAVVVVTTVAPGAGQRGYKRDHPIICHGEVWLPWQCDVVGQSIRSHRAVECVGEVPRSGVVIICKEAAAQRSDELNQGKAVVTRGGVGADALQHNNRGRRWSPIDKH